MRDLNDKLTGQELSADEWNDVPSELQNVIESTGQTLTDTDLMQLAKALAVYAGAGSFFVDSGSANSYVLAPVGDRKAPHEYTDGQRIEFVAANSNTASASNVNLASLGSKPIKTRTGANPAAGAISGRTRARYDAANGWFELTPSISSVYASRDTMYTDSGSTNNYVLTAVGDAPTAYFDGMIVRFRPNQNNTSVSNVNVNGLGAKSIQNASTRFIKAGTMVELEYNSSAGNFRILNTETFGTNTSGFKITGGEIKQWGRTGNLGDISSGAKSGTSSFFATFPNGLKFASCHLVSLNAADGLNVSVYYDELTSSASTIGYRYAEDSGAVQTSWAVGWVAIGS